MMHWGRSSASLTSGDEKHIYHTTVHTTDGSSLDADLASMKKFACHFLIDHLDEKYLQDAGDHLAECYMWQVEDRERAHVVPAPTKVIRAGKVISVTTAPLILSDE